MPGLAPLLLTAAALSAQPMTDESGQSVALLRSHRDPNAVAYFNDASNALLRGTAGSGNPKWDEYKAKHKGKWQTVPSHSVPKPKAKRSDRSELISRTRSSDSRSKQKQEEVQLKFKKIGLLAGDKTPQFEYKMQRHVNVLSDATAMAALSATLLAFIQSAFGETLSDGANAETVNYLIHGSDTALTMNSHNKWVDVHRTYNHRASDFWYFQHLNSQSNGTYSTHTHTHTHTRTAHFLLLCLQFAIQRQVTFWSSNSLFDRTY